MAELTSASLQTCTLCFVALVCFIITTPWTPASAKITHGDNCTSDASACAENTTCTHDGNGTRQCLCSKNFFYGKPNKTCIPDEYLKATNVSCTVSTTAINCTWSPIANVSFKVVEQDGRTTFVSEPKYILTAGLPPGASYNMTIISEIEAPPYYPYKKFTFKTNELICADAAKPAENVTVQKMKGKQGTYRYNLTFGASEGHVKMYQITLNVKKTNTTSPTIVEDLTPGQKYNYTIVAFNECDRSSEATSGVLTIDAEKASKVRDVTVKQAARSADIRWIRPTHPNGHISHYKLVAQAAESNGTLWNCAICINITAVTTQDNDNSCLQTQAGINTCTATHVSISGEVYSVTLQHLRPFTNYAVTLTSVNEAGEGIPQTHTFTTEIAVPDDVNSIEMSSFRNPDSRKITLTINWNRGSYAGPTRYNISVEGETSYNSGTFDTSRAIGYDATTIEVDDVRAYWNYKVSIRAYTDVGSSNLVTSGIHKTAENNPGVVQNLAVKQDEKYAQNVTVTFDCPLEHDRNGSLRNYILRKTFTSSSGNKTTNQTLPASPCSNPQTFSVDGIQSEVNYTFAVMAQNNYNGSFSHDVSLYTYPKKPQLAEKRVSDLIKKLENSQSHETYIDVQVCPSCLLDSSQGKVTAVGLIVCVQDENHPCSIADKNFTQYITWRQASNSAFNKPYRTTSDDWILQLNASTTSFSYEVGVDTNCDSNFIETMYCNGPLPSGKNIIVAVIVCTGGGCDTATSPDQFVTKLYQSKVGTITAVIVSILLLIFAAIVAFILWHKFAPQKLTWPVKMKEFEEYLKKLHKDSNLLLQSEFEDIRNICMTFRNTCNEAQREANRIKNRYVDILPYDHSRVKLDVESEGDETNDFINANYIPGFTSVREYIATQGPMPCTISDFWRMVWEQKCHVIVMLSDLQENGKLKVDQYWPENLNESVTFGNVVVEMMNFSQMNKYIIRNFNVTKGEETRRVSQFFLPGWWDFSANLSFDDVLEFVKLIRQEVTPETTGPIIVHCSAGVGRTGTLIALDYFMQFVDEHNLEDDIDVFAFVLRMRKNRTRMVQAESQYIFIYDAVLEMIKKKIKRMDENFSTYEATGDNADNVVETTQDASPYSENSANSSEALELKKLEVSPQENLERPEAEN